MVVIEAISLINSIAAYAFSLETLSRYGNHLVIAIAAGMVFFHLLTINPAHKRRFALISIVLSLLISGVTLMFNYQKNGYLAGELYMSDLFSPSLRVSSDKPVDRFLAEAEKIKTRVDAERSKEVSNDGEDGDQD
jgi:hypothetical protein